MTKAEVYVVRIYAGTADGSELRGIVEDVRSGSHDSFTSASELWRILSELYVANITLPAPGRDR